MKRREKIGKADGTGRSAWEQAGAGEQGTGGSGKEEKELETQKVNKITETENDGFEGIAGYAREKRELSELRAFLHRTEEYRGVGVSVPKSVLLYGRSGVGKTAMARAIADGGISTVELRAADCSEDGAAEKVVEAFAEAKVKAPCVLLLDELDKIAGFGMGEESIVSRVLLQELDRLHGGEGVLVVATCNRPDRLGGALLRSGRFDRKLRVEEPSEEDRGEILRLYLGQMSVPCEADIPYLARLTSGSTGATLERIVNEAGLAAMEKAEPVITLGDVCSVMGRLTFDGAPKDCAALRETAVHEAGHAVAGLILEPDSVYGACALTQGNTRGLTAIVPEDGGLRTLAQAENRIAISLAGRVAEREILGRVSMGCSSDLEQAVRIAKKLLQEIGAYGYEFLADPTQKNKPLFMRKEPEMSPAARKKLAEILSVQDARVTAIIRERRDMVLAIADALQEKTALSRGDLLAFTGAQGAQA